MDNMDNMEVRMREVEGILARIETKIDIALTNINDHECRLRSLEGKGGKRWDSIVTQVIMLIISAVFGIIVGKYI